MAKKTKRCPWPAEDALMQAYHDREWGVPVHDDRKHFEFLVLDGAQAVYLGEQSCTNARITVEHFTASIRIKIAHYTAADVKRLMNDAGIVRNKLKIRGAIESAKCFLAVQKEFGSFDRYIWQFTGGKTIHNSRRTHKGIPAKTKESDAMSKDLKKTRLQICWLHYLLRLHAGRRHGKRPLGRVLPSQKIKAMIRLIKVPRRR